MASEVRRRYRDAAASEVVRAGAQDPVRGAQFAGDQCRVRKNPGAKSEVDAVRDQIERVVREVQFNLGVRISGQKTEDRAGQDLPPETYRSRHADRARWLRSRFREPQIRVFDCPQRLTALLVIETSRVRHVEAACRALDQAHADLALERRNAAADRRLGHAKQAWGGCKTARFDDTGEHDDIVEIKHLWLEMGRCFPIIGDYGSMQHPQLAPVKTTGAVI